MYLYKELKQEIFTKHGYKKSETDTGSPEAQIALFTYRIAHLTEHLKKNKKDASTRLGLQKLVGKRRRLLTYLKKKDIERYRAIIKELGLRK
ncbi:MAG: 30S ribosomal protein S15 [Bacteroidota bacterium]